MSSLEKDPVEYRGLRGCNNAKVVSLLEFDNASKLIEQLIAFVGDDEGVRFLTKLIHNCQEVISASVIQRGIEDFVK